MSLNSLTRIVLPATVPKEQNVDRTVYAPPHVGQKVFQNTSLFSKLLRLAHQDPQRPIIRDDNLGIEKSRIQLLSDILALRQVVLESLTSEVLNLMRNDGEVYIGVLASGGYEFSVAMLTVLALGAAAVPMSTQIPVDELAYFAIKPKVVLVLNSSSTIKLGQSLEHCVNTSTDHRIRCISVTSHINVASLEPSDIIISSDCYADGNRPGLVVFTSGTTGRPKATVMRQASIYEAAIAVAEYYRITEDDTILHVLPVHHGTGLDMSFFPFLISGACIEFRSGSFSTSWTWDRWRQGGLTFFSGVPTIYMRMMRFYEQNLIKLPADDLEQYCVGARQFRGMLCGTSALPRPISQFWTKIRNGKTILTRYGATEFGAVVKVPLDARNTPDGSVGELVAGVDLKLSSGDEGEVLVRSPYMFSKYLFDADVTAQAHDADGYFKTGDIARREGKHYFIVGRASIDIIKSGGYKISALDIERECLGLAYIAEVMVVPVDDEEYGQRVAAVVTLREDQTEYTFDRLAGGKNLTLKDLRRDLSSKMARYKMPTLLRVVEGDIPKTASGKVLKKQLGPKYFPADYEGISEVQVWRQKRLAVTAKL
ncbi:Malonyl-synthetase [Hyphodiscus hymeniophilus]|uniref:Malonyl-synthetase n=1 Tax=Hyphodiscus hymeniophilus TaxID=353542 RepID=A0A9P7AZ11_9HELO|nr:Malonyl-synthetase [Hyphodiscus hymeniophilus]